MAGEQMFSRDWDVSIDKLLNNLTQELFHAEISAVCHCQHEADRLRHTAPAEAMLAISEHAREALQALLAVCAQHGLSTNAEASFTERVYAKLRNTFADRLVQSERAYRSTLLGVRHGVDLMRMLSLGAATANKSALAAFCVPWLKTRTELLQRAEVELQWFVHHPQSALLHVPPRPEPEKGAEQRWFGERYGRVEEGPLLHPLSKETGLKGASNVGLDETSGSE